MYIFSEKTVHFIDKIKTILQDILTQEVKVQASKNRFFDEKQRYSYPLSVIIYNDRNMLGYFDSSFFEMGFHECLMHANEKQLRDILRHELAHYLTFIKHGHPHQPHGAEFKNLCEQLGWGKEVYNATVHLDTETQAANAKENDLLRKIQKLMALGSSASCHEAESAMIKSQQLLLKHNIAVKEPTPGDEKVFLKRILKHKKRNAKMRAIGKILEAFFVHVVFHQGTDGVCLEILGSKLNIEIADYVAGFLEHKFEDLWAEAKREHRLTGAVAKNSFYLGIAKGYCNKIHALKNSYSGEETSALMVIEKQLQAANALAYRRLRSFTSQTNHCRTSANLGEQAGNKLQINPSISRTTESAIRYLTDKGSILK